jgi:hypothetical protein
MTKWDDAKAAEEAAIEAAKIKVTTIVDESTPTIVDESTPTV